jgi:oligopeptide transport system permease protein
LTENILLLKHAVRIAILPVVSFSGPMLADLLTGSFVIENIFQIPGIGVFFINSALNSDYTVAVDLALLYAILLIVLNLIVDFSYTWLDPRVKYE